LYEALHDFWKWWALQGMPMNKKTGLLKAKHLFSLSLSGEVLDQLGGGWEECPKP
jgi:hypothetical protein